MLTLIKRAAAPLLALLALLGCDQARIRQLQPGVSTEADVRSRFGAPDAVWDGAAGERVLEYDRQPEGHENYMIELGADGKLLGVRQVLAADTFARVVPGMSQEQVRRLLGKPAAATPYPLSGETAWDWRYIGAHNALMVFTVWFDPAGRVLRTATGLDLDAPQHRGN